MKTTSARDCFLETTDANAIPIRLVAQGQDLAQVAGLTDAQRRWLEAQKFTGAAKKHVLLPGADGSIAGVVLGIGKGEAGEPCGPAALLAGALAPVLPAGNYRLAEGTADATLAAIAWGLGAYRFRRYKDGNGEAQARLSLEGADRAHVLDTVEAIWQGRDLINTPAADMGPAEMEAAARALGERFGANVGAVVGEELLEKNFPMIHAVGRASPRAPRLIDLTWGRPEARKITLVGKGIAFDTGGLDIKPSSAMLLMKKDMGGAATALALGQMIMAAKLDVRLRVLVAAAENSVSGNAFRPGDVLKSRAGKTVEIGNTDAEGRLVLADALALADEEAPDMLFTFATLTGAARVALGPDVPAMFCQDEALAARIAATGRAVGDPTWRLPFWPGYDRWIDSEVADMNNVSEAPFAGAVVAALFLRRFVGKARAYAHFDIYGWRAAARPLGPKGGEPQMARALFEVLKASAAP